MTEKQPISPAESTLSASEVILGFTELAIHYPTFEGWLEGLLGQEVFHRITHNRHAVDLIQSAAYFDTIEDIQQKALIWLWQRWKTDPNYHQMTQRATEFSQAAGIITKNAVLHARCMYAKRRKEKREQQTHLFYPDGHERVIPHHDRPVMHADKRADVQRAIEAVVQHMVTDLTIPRTGIKSEGKPNQQFARIPIEHITRTIIEGYMYHYTDRYSQTGSFRKFCEARGVSKNQIARWRPQIMAYLREELAAYAPVTQTANQTIEIAAPLTPLTAQLTDQKTTKHSEAALQYNLFSNDLVDNRTKIQKQADKQRRQPQQGEMFRAADIAQFGVNPHPLFSLSPHMLLPMMSEDPRTEEEIEADRLKAALELTTPMFTNEETTINLNSQRSGTMEGVVFEQTSYKEQSPENPKLATYLNLVQAAREVLFWGTTDGIIVTGVAVHLALAVLAANEAGLTQAEIKAAVQIGEQQGLPLTKPLPPIPKIYPPHYWRQIEEEAYAFWNEKLQPKSIF